MTTKINSIITYRHLSYALLLLLFSLLNACSTVTPPCHKDGPPPFYVDETKISNAVPRKEPLSKYGNMPVYAVFGEKYHVMQKRQHYEATGVASWYGTKFHAHKTSSGEPYDMLAMTAAHKTLPLPTYVQVTNLKNNRRIIVKVNDRGPFASDRIIDLSYVAAKKLGMLGHGTTMVHISSIDFDIPRRIYAAHKKLRHQLQQFHEWVYLQVGAFKNRHYAEKLKSRVSGLTSLPVKITDLAQRTKGLYHVRIGPIKDLASVDHVTKRLKSIGLPSKKLLVHNAEA